MSETHLLKPKRVEETPKQEQYHNFAGQGDSNAPILENMPDNTSTASTAVRPADSICNRSEDKFEIRYRLAVAFTKTDRSGEHCHQDPDNSFFSRPH